MEIISIQSHIVFEKTYLKTYFNYKLLKRHVPTLSQIINSKNSLRLRLLIHCLYILEIRIPPVRDQDYFPVEINDQ